MRVRRTVPQFTFGFSATNVNRFYRVSTGFLRFSSVLSGFWHFKEKKGRFTAFDVF